MEFAQKMLSFLSSFPKVSNGKASTFAAIKTNLLKESTLQYFSIDYKTRRFLSLNVLRKTNSI